MSTGVTPDQGVLQREDRKPHRGGVTPSSLSILLTSRACSTQGRATLASISSKMFFTAPERSSSPVSRHYFYSLPALATPHSVCLHLPIHNIYTRSVLQEFHLQKKKKKCNTAYDINSIKVVQIMGRTDFGSLRWLNIELESIHSPVTQMSNFRRNQGVCVWRGVGVGG